MVEAKDLGRSELVMNKPALTTGIPVIAYGEAFVSWAGLIFIESAITAEAL
jgi:hypothetical protein